MYKLGDKLLGFTSGCLFAAVALAGVLLVRHYVA
jgi:hypothetical protein